MAVTKYTYSILNNTLNAKLNSNALSEQIQSSSIVTALDHISLLGDVLDIYFKDSISAGDKTTLDNTVALHDGTPINGDPEQIEISSQPAFASKITPEGKKLFGREHGKSFQLTAGANTLDFDIPYATCKITGLEVINGEIGDTLDFFILDDDLGTYSTIPNYPLNRFGFDVAIANDIYKRDSAYDADLYYNMCISIAYFSSTTKTVYINYILHEVKD